MVLNCSGRGCGHLETLGCRNRVGCRCWHRVGHAPGCCSTPWNTQDGSMKRRLVQPNAYSAEAEKPQDRLNGTRITPFFLMSGLSVGSNALGVSRSPHSKSPADVQRRTTPKQEELREVRIKRGTSSNQSFPVVILPECMLINQLQQRFTERNYIFI